MNQVKFSADAYGYSVNSSGFMGADFNEAAGLPQDFKIHKKTLDEIVEFNEKSFIQKRSKNSKVFANIDVADTIKQWYKIFDSVTGGIDKEEFNEQDLAKLPKGFGYSAGKLDENSVLSDKSTYKVTNVFRTQEQLEDATNLRDELSSIGANFYISKLDLTKQGLERQRDGLVHFNPDMSPYKTQNGFSKEGVFVGFLKSVNAKASNSGETKMEGGALAYALVLQKEFKSKTNDINFDKIVQDETLIYELLKHRGKDMAHKILLSEDEAKKQADEIMARVQA
ncbi:MAG: Cj0814 family flagellar-dependent secreted protein [Campylobacter curvus]